MSSRGKLPKYGSPGSLSMKMRSEALKFPGPSEAPLGEGEMKEPSNYSLPYIQTWEPESKDHRKNRLSHKGHRTGDKKNSEHASRTKDLPAPSQDKQIEKMSGTFDIDFSFGGFPDRCEIHQPSAMCLRCSGTAQVCMKCTEALVEKAVTFYRQTRAKGASLLFNNALAQVGITKLAKFMIFRSWHNGFLSRSRVEKKMKSIVDKFFNKTGTDVPFKSWKKFTKESIAKREREHQEDIKVRLHNTEELAEKLKAQNTALSQQIKDMSTSIGERDKVITEQKERIEKLEKDLTSQKKRVVGLSGLTQPLRHLMSMVEQASMLDNTSMRRHLIHTIEVPAYHDDNPLYDGEFLTQLAESKDELAKLHSILIRWVNVTSQRASGITDQETGNGLDSFLPPFREALDFDTLVGGDHICRTIAVLLFDQQGFLDLTKKEGHTIAGLGSDKAVANADLYTFLDSVKKIRYGKSKQKDLFALGIAQAVDILGLGRYNAEALIRMGAGATASLVAHLMMLAAPIRQPQAQDASVRMAGDYELVRQQLLMGLKERTSIRNLHEFFGVTVKLAEQRRRDAAEEAERLKAQKAKDLAEGDAIMVAGPEEKKEDSVVATDLPSSGEEEVAAREDEAEAVASGGGDASEGAVETGEGDATPEEGGEGEEGIEDEYAALKPTVDELLIPPEEALDEDTYKKLTSLVDAYLRNGTEQKMLYENMKKLDQGLMRSRELRQEIEDGREHQDDGVRLATATRRFVQSRALEGVLAKAGLLEEV